MSPGTGPQGEFAEFESKHPNPKDFFLPEMPNDLGRISFNARIHPAEVERLAYDMKPDMSFVLKELCGRVTWYSFVDYVMLDYGDNISLRAKNQQSGFDELIKINFEPDENDPYISHKLKNEEAVVRRLWDNSWHHHIIPHRPLLAADGRELIARAWYPDTIDVQELPFRTVVDLTLQIGSAVEWMHSLGIVHRDIRWGNIFVTACKGDHFAWLLDFDDSSFFEGERWRDIWGPKGLATLLQSCSQLTPEEDERRAQVLAMTREKQFSTVTELMRAIKELL